MTIPTDNIEEMNDGRFKKGISGNPSGKKKGTPNRTDTVAITLFEESIEEITKRVIELALFGDIRAIKLILDRVVPTKREREANLNPPTPRDADIGDHIKLDSGLDS